MKRIFIFALMVIFASCHKSTVLVAENYTFVPIWRNDTLMNGFRINPTDTIYSFISNDTTGIISHGDTFYVFGVFDTTVSSSYRAFVGQDPLDTTTALSRAVVGYYRWFDANNNASQTQQQRISITTRYPNFETSGDNNYFGR